jgi:hypothetical protein
MWQEGGAFIPGTANRFGGSSATEFGTTPLLLTYPDPNPAGFTDRFNDFRHVLSFNPCPSGGGGDDNVGD